MGRKKKNVLNQIIKEPVVEKKIEAVIIEPEIEEVGAKLLTPDIESLIPTPIEEVSLKVSGEKLAEVIKEKENLIYEDDGDEDGGIEESVVEGITITKPSKEQLLRLSKSGLRWYQRTGRLPK